MSKTDSPAGDSDLPAQVTVGLKDVDDKRQWWGVKQHLAGRRGCDPDDVTHVDVARELLETYQFRRLQDDQRIKEARHAVASDHNVDTDDVTLRSLLKITAGAYTGYRSTRDWLDDDA